MHQGYKRQGKKVLLSQKFIKTQMLFPMKEFYQSLNHFIFNYYEIFTKI